MGKSVSNILERSLVCYGSSSVLFISSISLVDTAVSFLSVNLTYTECPSNNNQKFVL